MKRNQIETFFSLSNLYLAYRKAKAEAFYENTHFHALRFTKYEQNLDKNLKILQQRLLNVSQNWFQDLSFIGDFAYLPKSVDCSVWDSKGSGHFRALDPRQDWARRYSEKKSPAQASLRLVIRPTIDFQIVSALWILHVGHLFDAALDQRTSFGNRLRRSGAAARDVRVSANGLNLTTPGLFAPYFSAYRQWREGGLATMETALSKGESILAITMDIERFYHRVSPKFLLRSSFLEAIGLTLRSEEREFTRELLQAIETWYASTPDSLTRPEGAIPVGLSSSKIIANVLLAQFDREIVVRSNPLFYGRYVDDLFLVLRAREGDFDADSVTTRLAIELSPYLILKRNAEESHSLKLNLPYARDSELIFAGKKQKIFALASEHGSDLVRHIRNQIREQSSEYRLLPEVPVSGIDMASRALLATPDASLQVDALRKADAVSVRRLGFSLLLSDIETYAADLRPTSWRDVRKEFYGLVQRHVLTPVGFFDFFSYIPRVFGLMLACGDIKDAKDLADDLIDVAKLLGETTTLKFQKEDFNLCLEQYASALLEAGLKAGTARKLTLDAGYLGVIRRLKRLSPRLSVPSSVSSLQSLVKQVLLADWGRRPYKDYWFIDQHVDEKGPRIPREISVRRQLRLGGLRRFRKTATNLHVPHWPALAFSTRPLRVDEIALVEPTVLHDQEKLKDAIKLLRGAGVASKSSLGFLSGQDDDSISMFLAPGKAKNELRIAVTSVETTDKQWELAASNRHDRSLNRYMAFNELMNRILKEPKRPDYIVLPELSVPLRWALRAARKLADNGVSFLAGVEYTRDRMTRKLRNDCLVSLTTRWPGYASNIVVLQPKFEPAHGERVLLKKTLRKDGVFFKPTGLMARPVVYGHKGFYFSSLVCSDLTNITHRHHLRGKVDALFALEWNPDTKTFSALVEATATDMHAFVVQANNRRFGDSRIRSPANNDYERDVVQVKGGIADYYVLGGVDYQRLRLEQRRRPKKSLFKPTPIGYVQAAWRKPKRKS
ncbi:RNA-directed DNA polymerase [Variovorax ureilyticus]|uniref:RNA-directed DNA polymerase n=1 Tax=Variovorax ureilyticus TaxID=1836198 RepID=UPI003D6773EB